MCESVLRLDWCSHDAAKYAVEHYHYSRSMPAGKTVKVGPEVPFVAAISYAVVKQKFAYPAERFEGRGIVICGGGAKYFPCVYVLVRLLRHLGCQLPIEVWHLGAKEMTGAMRGLL